ncbi:MAG TPA: NAD-binding protein [Bacteroidales bacterium]|nr:NAD-binding protein [Bacteroidales bacterium]HQH19627.1 NAD-binding protein [Bacteroidales bacterium]HQI46082.1 NAD-binding protein [Bacteroidales bacterium]
MKFIVVGMGNFGALLAEQLTLSGHEVLGIDISMHKIEEIKDKITHAVCMDITERSSASTLPLKDTNVVIVAIGKDFATSIKATAILKELGAKKLISRAFSPLHETVLKAINIDQIVNPEFEFAKQFAQIITSS